jgi:guanosine-3',5'-bis(diphosphate) 3'-pyrophosphohydrolase
MNMQDTESILQQVTRFADNWHGDQMRRYVPDRYIVHPVRVMETCRRYTNDLPTLAAALLHDVLEDTPVKKEAVEDYLRTIMSEADAKRTVMIVEELTDVYIKAEYPKWNRRKRKDKEAARLANTSAEAQTVKYADIIDNAPEIAEKDPDFAKRFLPEYRALLKKITRGNAELHAIAVETVKSHLEKAAG